MKMYKDYLQKKGYTQSSITGIYRQGQLFDQWCARQHTAVSEVDYKTCLKYLKQLSQRGNSKRTVNAKLGSLRIYFDYQIHLGARTDNPLADTHIKGIKRNMTYHLLDGEELEDLYYSFTKDDYQEEYHKYTAMRGKVIVGLLVYQGLTTTDLGLLRMEHLKLAKGMIYVPSSRKSNARELELKPWQIMAFMEYQNEVRPKLQAKMKNYSEQLFPINTKLSVIIPGIIKRLKSCNQRICNVYQIRASVLTLWLGQYNLRKVQYLAGHRYISSTERYLQDDLENLHEMVNNFHPIH